MSSHAEVSRAALSILGVRIGIYPLKIAVGLAVASVLGTTNYGIYAFLILPGSVILPLMTFGLAIGVRYYVSSEEYHARDVAFMALLLGLFTGAIAAGVFGVLWDLGLLGKTGAAVTAEWLLPILLVLPIQGAALFMNVVIVGASWFSALNVYIFLNNLAPPVLLMGLVLIGGLGISGAVAAIVAANVLLAVVSVSMVVIKFRPRLRIELGFLLKAARYGIKAWVGTLANRASVRLDQFVLAFVQSPDVLGVYRIAVMIAELLWLIPDAVNVPLFNRVSRTEGLQERLSVVMRSHRLLILIVGILGLCMLVGSWWAIPLILGPDYLDARWLFALLLPGALSLVTSRFLGMFFSASGKPERSSTVEVVGAVASVVGYLTLIPWLGVAGAAIATSAAYILIAATAYWMFSVEAKPYPVKLYRATRDDLKWAIDLVRDSLAIWRARFRGAD
jgi:O-antigen/teichoic acid export membrane protein